MRDIDYWISVGRKLIKSFRFIFHALAYLLALFIFFFNVSELWNNTETSFGNIVGAVLSFTIPYLASLVDMWVCWLFKKEDTIHI
jgi:hypothetical protein